MPILLLPTRLPIELQALWIHAHMLFPDELPLARRLFARYLVGRQLKDAAPEKEITLPVSWIRDLAFGPSLAELAKIEKKREKAGRTAGCVLALVFLMAKGNYDIPSVNKAARIIETHIAKLKKQGQRPHLYSDRREILAAWKLMQNSAHLWASLHFLTSPAMTQLTQSTPEAFGIPERFEIYLKFAAAYRQFGCNHKESHTRAKKSLLEASKTLQLPDYIEANIPLIGDIPIPEELLAYLSDYRAPQSI